MKDWRITGLRCLIGVGLLAITLLGLVISVWYVNGGRILSVQTNSMNPTFHAGDGVVVQRVRPRQLRAGDVIAYRTLVSGVIISHRIQSVQSRPLSFTTEGDNTSQTDPPVQPSQLVGKVTAIAPSYGRWLRMLRSPVGLSLAVYIPGGLIIVTELVRYSKHLRYRAVYRLYPK